MHLDKEFLDMSEAHDRVSIASKTAGDHSGDTRGNIYSEAQGYDGPLYVVGGHGNVQFLGRRGDDLFLLNSDSYVCLQDLALPHMTECSANWDRIVVSELGGDYTTDELTVVHHPGGTYGTATFQLKIGNKVLAEINYHDPIDPDDEEAVATAIRQISGQIDYEKGGWLNGAAGDDLLWGGDGDDFIIGGKGNDVLEGGDGNDEVRGMHGDDILRGGDGDDFIIGGKGNDVLEGGDGNDEVHGQHGDDILRGGDGDDFIIGGKGNDVLYGSAGDDDLRGGDGNDRLDGGTGRDTLFGEGGRDTFVITSLQADPDIIMDFNVSEDVIWLPVGMRQADVRFVWNDARKEHQLVTGTGASQKVMARFANLGSAHNAAYLNANVHFIWNFGPAPEPAPGRTIDGTERKDLFIGGHGAGAHTIYSLGGMDALHGQGGDDTMDGGEKRDVLYGNEGDDTLFGGVGNDYLFGGIGGDHLYGDQGNDRLHGEQGNDTLEGGKDNDILHGGAGDDILSGGAGDDQLHGGAGDDILSGGAGDDRLHGGAGDDILSGGAGDDRLHGGADDDTLSGGAGDDRLHGGAGDDTLSGGTGDDRLHGGAGDDTLSGGAGDDRLHGGAGDDTLSGGAGHDGFLFHTGDGEDVITDFEDGADTIVIVAQTEAQAQVGHEEMFIDFDDLNLGDDQDSEGRNYVVITSEEFAEGQKITVHGVTSGQLTDEDVDFLTADAYDEDELTIM